MNFSIKMFSWKLDSMPQHSSKTMEWLLGRLVSNSYWQHCHDLRCVLIFMLCSRNLQELSIIVAQFSTQYETRSDIQDSLWSCLCGEMSNCGTFKGPARKIPRTLNQEDNKRQHQKREKTQAETQSGIINNWVFLQGMFLSVLFLYSSWEERA